MQYRAISVRQPWATLLAFGIKAHETRCWPCEQWGLLAIHASAILRPKDRAWARENVDIRRLLAQCGYDDVTALPLGAVLAVGEFTGCYPTRAYGVLSRTERALGDWSPGRWAWRIENVKLLPHPIPYKGRLGLWTCEIDWEWPGPREGA